MCLGRKRGVGYARVSEQSKMKQFDRCMNKKLHTRRKIMKQTLKKSVSILLSLLMIVSLFTIVPLTAHAETENLGSDVFTVESDSEGTYYKIDCANALNALADYVNAGNDTSKMRFKQTADIDMKGVSYTPIGNVENTHVFYGIYDGDGYVIKNISHTISQDYSLSGLFGQVNGTVQNVNLKDCNFEGREVGGIAGKMKGGASILNCNVIGGTITGKGSFAAGYLGGIVGNGFSGVIKDCFCTASFSGDGRKKAPISGDTGANVYTSSYINAPVSSTNSRGTQVTGGFITLADDITISGVWLTIGKTEENTYYFGKENDVISFGCAAGSGYRACYFVNGTAIEGDTYTMETDDLTVSATISIDPARFSQDGDTYTIHDAAGWDVFCDMLADSDKGVFTGKTVELADDITVTRMAGSSYHDFTGTFDGKGHTLTFNSTDAVDYCAPFQYTEGTPVFCDLIIDGTINTSGAYAAGLIGHLYGNVSIERCTSRVEITSNGNSGGFVGLCEQEVAFKDCVSSAVIHCNAGNNSGFVGWSRSSKYTISFEGCVFNGKLLKNDGTGNNGGFIGWKGDDKTVTVTNCLYAPALVEGEAFADSNSATFSREHSDHAATITNCYYTRTLGTAQGKQPYTITAGDDVTLGLAGDATEYGVSGITAYAGSNGLKYGETTLYAGSGDTVTLTVAPSAVGYAVNSVSVNDGAVAVTSNENGTYSFTMPASNAAVTAELEEASYFDASTGTLTLKGNVLNSVAGIVLPDGVKNDAVRHINVDSSGATLPQDSTWLFRYLPSLLTMDLTGADTSGVEDMYGMFFQCNLRKLVLSGFDTSRVKNMGYMFGGCVFLKKLDLSSFDTSRVEDMNHMFSICGGLTELDLSNFDTSSVMDMNNMFYNCASLETLDLSSFDTSCVVDMSGMFIACVNLTELDLSSFDTSSVKNMEHMFEYCDFLKKLDLSSFDTSFVKSMTNMFSGCEHLTELNLSSFDTSCVEDMSGMFSCCYLLKTIYVSEQWSTECVYNSKDMFEYCKLLKGGNGTAYDGSKTNREYACIDKDGQPGYLTGTYAVTVPAGITISPVNAIIDSVPFCVKGETITISPREGYIIADVFVFIDIGYDIIEIEITDNNDGTYSFTMPESNVSVEVETAFTDGIGAALAGHSISLEGDIGVNFYMALDPEIAQSETAYMQFTIPNGSKSETKTVFVKEAREDGGYYIFKCSVAAKDMSSEISAQLIDGDKTSTVYTYSVREYADYLIEHRKESQTFKDAAPLVEKMLRFGAYAKEYFDETNTLPDLGDVNIDSQFATYTSSLPEGLYSGSTLSLKSQTTLSHYFTDEDELTFTCVDKDGAERTVETVRNGSTQIARIRNIAAKELQDDFTLTVKKGETVLGAITYSPMNYCYKVLHGGTTDARLQNVVKALAAYSDAAKLYFGS